MRAVLIPSFLASITFAGLACVPDEQAPVDPSDDPDDWDVDTAIEYAPVLGEPRFIVGFGADIDTVPREHLPLASNNNVAITFHEGSLFMAWRTAESHFASENAELHVIRSDDGGTTWVGEHLIKMGSDVREPQLISFGGTLWLSFFQAGTNKFAFEPRGLWRTHRRGPGDWAELEAWGRAVADPDVVAEVPWDLKLRGGRLLLTSYTGGHYDFTAEESELAQHLQVSDDGVTWSDVDPGNPDLYVGGASEAGFEIDDDGRLWALLRNEDGDGTGFGSLLCVSSADNIAAWDCPEESDPERYDSPKLLRHGDDLYMIARRDIGGPFDQGEDDRPLEDRRLGYNADYWVRPKRTALYAITETERRVEHLFDLPSAGDTSFPSIRRTGQHTFLVANYTSDINDPDRSWLEGQDALEGTGIYLIELRFEPR